MVWHHDRHVGFRKTIRLDGRTVCVRYEGVRPGHVVANDLCLHAEAALRGQHQIKLPAADARSILLRGADGVSVRLSVQDNCRFTPEALLTRASPDPAAEAERRRLYRPMIDNLELSCPEGGDFSYRIEL